ncbi:uncharacterized protein P174DRAFT_428770 [Aspergillus novofumigatus IBT 16806]|uniref:Uncharacterized protein n=1 Tax=Aspergillus novofumigatus (strain IBT 16806) TaxID=1392255 RepID=A0A2I1CI63_ASPN1|nr:uncharacterized protein P174DRAFT_428770 [Aspergillus novofumigatus IBT 16806]PKX97318.1 hypothetical protein P174DRAFT_428770 [Aspergillus novofumigatus IBT 16806]
MVSPRDIRLHHIYPHDRPCLRPQRRVRGRLYLTDESDSVAGSSVKEKTRTLKAAASASVSGGVFRLSVPLYPTTGGRYPSHKDPQLVRKAFRLRAPDRALFQSVLGDAKNVSIADGNLQVDLRSRTIKADMFTTFTSVAQRCEWRWPTNDDGARSVIIGAGTNDVTGELETLLPAAHYNREPPSKNRADGAFLLLAYNNQLKATSHYEVQFRRRTKDYEREDLYDLRQTDDDDEYSNAGFLYGSKSDSSNLLVAFVDARGLRAKDGSSNAENEDDLRWVKLAHRQLLLALTTTDSTRGVQLERQINAAIEAVVNPDPNRSVELDNGAFVAVNLFEQKGTHLGWLGPNGQVVKMQNDGPLGVFQLEYTLETTDEASRRAPGRYELNIPADEATVSATRGPSAKRPASTSTSWRRIAVCAAHAAGAA